MAARVKVLPSTAPSWSRRRSSGDSPSSRAAIKAWSVSGTSSSLDLAGQPVGRAVESEQPAVEQHAHRLDRVQRDALGTVEDLVAQAVRKAGHEAVEELSHRLVGERLEEERGEVSLAGAPGGTPFLELGAGEGDDEQRIVPRPLEQVLDEVEQARVGPLHVLEREHGRPLVGQALEEQAPGGEQVLPVRLQALLEAREMGESRLDELSLARVEYVLLQRGAQLPARGLRILFLADAAAHPHHVRERPVGDALAVREAAPAVPPDQLDDAVEVLVELPGQARLADAADAGDRHEMGAAILRRRVEEVLDQLQLAVAADEGGLETRRLQLPAAPRDDPHRSVDLHGLGLSLQLVSAGRLVHDRLLRRAPRRLADEHRAGLRDRLDTRGGVDEIARDHALALGADRHRRLSGQDPRACLRARDRARGRRPRGRGPRGLPARRHPPWRPAFPRPPSRRRR